MSLFGVSVNLVYTISATVGSLGALALTGLPLYLRWRSDQRNRERTQWLVWDELIGHKADPAQGIPEKPPLATRLERVQKKTDQMSEVLSEIQQEQHEQATKLTDHLVQARKDVERLDDKLRQHERKYHR